MDWIKSQAQQPSTYRGLVAFATAAGLGSTATNIISLAGTVIIGLIGLWDVLRNGRSFGAPGA